MDVQYIAIRGSEKVVDAVGGATKVEILATWMLRTSLRWLFSLCFTCNMEL